MSYQNISTTNKSDEAIKLCGGVPLVAFGLLAPKLVGSYRPNFISSDGSLYCSHFTNTDTTAMYNIKIQTKLNVTNK